MRAYFKAEAMKYRNSAVGKIVIFMPVICVALAAVLTHNYFVIDSYNWWYGMMYPGLMALVCGVIGNKDRKMGNRTIVSLPYDMKKIWDAKVLYGILVASIATFLLTSLTMVVSIIMENILQITFIINPSILMQLLAFFVLWISFLWQVPFCLFLSQVVGVIPMLLIHMATYIVMFSVASLGKFYMLFPGALASRMMCVVLGVLPNGLPAQPGEMTYTPELVDSISLFIGIPAAIVWFIFLWWPSRRWFERQVEKCG